MYPEEVLVFILSVLVFKFTVRGLLSAIYNYNYYYAFKKFPTNSLREFGPQMPSSKDGVLSSQCQLDVVQEYLTGGVYREVVWLLETQP